MNPFLSFPFFEAGVPAGFPSPADDYLESSLNLEELLVPRPSSTFFIRVKGDSMKGAGIFSGDILVVDRSLNAKPGDVVVALWNGEFTVKRLIKKETGYFLAPENPRYPLFPLSDDAEFQIWGVVTFAIHRTHGI
jgi:DNA polymerase V